MTQKSLNKLKEFEGCKLKAYLCPAGKWTIGYGTTAGVKPGMVISKSQADVFLDADIEALEHQLEKIPTLTSLKPHQWDALVDFAYNLGVSNLLSSTLLKKVKANPADPCIPVEFSRWVYVTAGGVKKKMPGLVKRRAWEAKRWQGLV